VQGDRAVTLPCPCDGVDCYHVKTHHQRNQVPGAMANNDYLFASASVAAELVSLEVRNGDADAAWAHSDHVPLIATFRT
jgi:exonuclease III